MTEPSRKITVGVCETQPVTAEGLRALVSSSPEMEFVRAVQSLQGGTEMVRSLRPAVVLADKALGIHGLLQWLVELRSVWSPTAIAVWGVTISEEEALRFVQAGAKGILRKSAETSTVLACLRAVAAGATWMEEAIFRDTPRHARVAHTALTPREQQVYELVQQGLRNTDISRELGIRPGTVKIHLKHIFEKTGIRGRYGLALSGLKEKSFMEVARV